MNDTKRCRQDFQTIRKLGDGAYSSVLLVQEKQEHGKQYAMKIVDKAFLQRYQKQHVVLNEKRALLACNHPSIIHLYHTFRDDDSLYFILELAEVGDIADDIKRHGAYQLPRACYYIAALLNALHYLHYSIGVVHRDVKPENLLLDARGRLKLADFGSCRFINDADQPTDKRTNFVGTASYVPPELLNGQCHLGIGADWWAAGCVLYQMLTGEPLYRGTSEYLIFQSILNDKMVFPEGFDANARDLICRLMDRHPDQRLGVHDTDWQIIKSHPFFAGYDIGNIHLCDPPTQDILSVVNPPAEDIQVNPPIQQIDIAVKSSFQTEKVPRSSLYQRFTSCLSFPQAKQ